MEFGVSLNQLVHSLQNEIIYIFSQFYTTNTVNRILFLFVKNSKFNTAIKYKKTLSSEQIYDHKLTPLSNLLTVADFVIVIVFAEKNLMN